MKKSIYFYLLSFLVIAMSCTKDFPNPALPDVKSIPTDPIKSFGLVSPASGIAVTVFTSSQTVVIDWDDSPDATTYEWVADLPTGTFATPKLVIPADNSGKLSKLTLTYTQIDALLATAGIAVGGSVDYKWSVRAKSGTNVRLASTPRNITFKRGGVTFTINVPANTPAGFDVYFAGAFGFLTGTDWQTPGSNQALKFTKNSNGTYSIILGIPPGQTFEYKYFIAPVGGQSFSYGEREPNANGVGTKGLSNRKFTYTGTNNDNYQVVSFWEGYDYPYISFNLTAPANTPTDRGVFVAGQFNRLGVAPSEWQKPGENPSLQMTKSTPTGLDYFIVFPQPASGTSVTFKYFVASVNAPTWGNGSNNGDQTFTFNGSNNSRSDTVTSWEGI
jgi:hypothetical protein